MKIRLTIRILRAIQIALGFILASEWDEDTHGQIEDFELAHQWVSREIAKRETAYKSTYK